MYRIFKYISFFTLIFYIPVSQVLAQPDLYKVEKVAVSTGANNEIAPVIRENGIIFCSDRRISSIKNITTYKDEKLFNIYMATRIDSLRWNKPEELKGQGSQLLYFGPLSLASDNKTIYFTSSLLSGKAARKKGDNPRGIFIGEITGNNIINITPFQFNDIASKYSVAHPSISRDGKYLFFASDMPGGEGGSDIYYCENTGGKWANPVNLGPRVNSASKENYPYIHPSGRLYFSSDRPGNADYLGGWDVYFTSLYYGEWDTPAPMPAPINSTSDDFAFVAEENLQNGYFTRKSGSNDDIFSFSSMIIRKVACDTMQVNNYCYEFVEENAVKFDTMPVPFKYQWNFGDGAIAQGVKAEHCYKGPGKYIVRLDVLNTITNKVETNEKTYDLEITDIEQPFISAPDKWNSGQSLKLSADSTNLPGWTINQYYWNFGDDAIEIGKNVVHTYIRPGRYNIQLIVTGTTDAGGAVREACVSKNINVIRKP